MRKNPEILSPRTAWEWIFHHFRIPWNSPFFGLFWAFSGIPKNSRKRLSSNVWFRFYETCTVCVKHKIKKQDTSGVCTPECVTVCTVCTSRRLRVRAVLRKDVASWAEWFSFFFFIFTSTRSSYRFPHKRPADVVRGIGMTQDAEWRRFAILCGSPMVPFFNFGLPSTKSGKTNGVLVEGDFARR